MRRFVVLCFALMALSSSAFADGKVSAGSAVLADRPAGEVRVVLYMTTW